jgi:hypothetical protein
MVRRSAVATYCSAGSAVERFEHDPSPSSTSGAGAAPLEPGFKVSVARTRVALGSSETSSATVSTSQSGGR